MRVNKKPLFPKKPSDIQLFEFVHYFNSLHCAGTHQSKIAKFSQFSPKLMKPIQMCFKLFQTLLNTTLIYDLISVHFPKPLVEGISRNLLSFTVV